jgi:4-hydroxy-2-oxoheptanedioate aldolase
MDIKKRDFLTAGLGIGVSAGFAASGAFAQPAPGGAPGGGGRGAATPPALGRGGLPVGEADVMGLGRGISANSGVQPSSVDLNYKPRRVNKVIELWEDGQPAYFTNSGMRPGVDAYEQGKKMAKTFADLIIYGLEHGPLDFTDFVNFMSGLKDGGPTKSGHTTPTVIVEVPCTGRSAEYALANSWIITNLLDLGAHGIQIKHARDPKAIETYVQIAARYPFDYPNTPKVPQQGMGMRGQTAPMASNLWGVSDYKYLHIADVWPLNPRGEILMGSSIEDKIGGDNMEKILATKGLAFAEWGSSESALSVLGLAAYPEDHVSGRVAFTPEQSAAMKAMSDKVQDQCKKNNLRFLGGPELRGGGEAGAIAGREASKRKMPV